MVSLGQIRSWNSQYFAHCEMFAAFRELLAQDNDVGVSADEILFDRQFELVWLDRAFVMELTFSTPEMVHNTKSCSRSRVTCYELKTRGSDESIDGEMRAIKLGSCELIISGLQRGFVFTIGRSCVSFCPSEFTDALWVFLTMAGLELETASFQLSSNLVKVRAPRRNLMVTNPTRPIVHPLGHADKAS